MNIINSPFLFLQKTKKEIEDYLNSKQIIFEYFPDEQKNKVTMR